jgi:CRP-like cAMP-binding protein
VWEDNSDKIKLWDAFIFVTTSLLINIIPIRIGFLMTQNAEWLALDLVCDISYIIDMAVRSRRSFFEHGELVKDLDKIRERYIYSWEFAVDVISVLPIDFVAIAFPSYRACFLANRLLRVRYVWQTLSTWEMVTSFKPSLVTMIKSLIFFYYVVHVDACLKHLILYFENNDEQIRFMTSTNYLKGSGFNRYARAFYLTLLTASGFAASSPTTAAELLISIFDCIFSIGVFGVIIGVFANLVANLDASRIYFFHQLDDANEYMRTQKLGPDLKLKVNEYYQYLWSSGQALEKNEVLQMLPASIRHTISYHVTSSFIKKVPFFEEIQREEFFIEICKNLLPRTALPDTYVVKKGEMGTEMYFVLRGELNVVLDNGKVVHTFTSGGFFGEIAIMYQIKRTATIIARTYCDIFVLGKNEFSKVLKKFPKESKRIREVAKARFEAINSGEKEKKEAEQRAREQELREATARAEQTAAENAALDAEIMSADSRDLGSDSDGDKSPDAAAAAAHGEQPQPAAAQDANRPAANAEAEPLLHRPAANAEGR